MLPVETYALPLLPMATRLLLAVRWSWLMFVDLPELAQERDAQRGYILSLAGFSFTAVAGLIVLDSTLKVKLQLPIWFVLTSFLAFLASLNMQAYKSTRWQNQLAASLRECGTLSLISALCSLLLAAPFDPFFQGAASFLAALTWLIDHAVCLRIDHRYFYEVDLALRQRLNQ